MRIWKCDKCEKEIKSFKFPEGFYICKIFSKAQSKGGKSTTVELCDLCCSALFNSIRKEISND